MTYPIILDSDVKKALQNKEAVVALESTIIAHGMPKPDNLQIALELETIVRDAGAVPATIAIIDGAVMVGLSESMLTRLANEDDVMKLSKRDLAYAVSQKKTGATTVSATMLIASMAGIEVFATGGIGGVHRGASETFDISRDLEELAYENVTVVCAGAKSILDLPKTLEYLETRGVEVIGYKTDELPAFYARTSGLKVAHRLDDAKAIAALIDAKRQLKLSGGIVIANPIDKAHAIAYDVIEAAINDAIEAAKQHHVHGKALTPWLLSRIEKATNKKSLAANKALVKSNAALAAAIAKALSERKKTML